MCTRIIIDVNVLSETLADSTKTGDPLLRRWITRGHGIVVYSDTGKYHQEMARGNKKTLELLGQYRRANRLYQVTEKQLQDARKGISKLDTRSNDKHILTLAYASRALILCTKDKDLQQDFTNTKFLPKIGKSNRSVYPMKQARKIRSEFLEKRKCPNRSIG